MILFYNTCDLHCVLRRMWKYVGCAHKLGFLRVYWMEKSRSEIICGHGKKQNLRIFAIF